MKKLKLLIVLLLLQFIFIPTLNANSVQPYYSGIDAGGIFISGTNSPIDVIKEDLVFDIQDTETIQANYTLKNTLDATINAQFYFPYVMGNLNYFYSNKSLTSSINVKRNLDDPNSKYEGLNLISRMVAVDDNNYLESFNNIKNEYETYTFNEVTYTKDSPIYVYTLEFETPRGKDDAFYFTFDNNKLISTQRLYYNDSNEYCVYVNRQTNEASFVSFEDIDILDITNYCDLPNNAKVINKTKQTQTFKEFVLSKVVADYYDTEQTKEILNSVCDIDKYNYYIYLLNRNETKYFDYVTSFASVMFFYDFTIEFKPYETLENSVVTKTYPFIDMTYEPNLLKYVYYLTPASTFKNFNDLTITIKTTNYLTYSSIEFDKCDEGYTAKFDTLPECDLSFELCSSPNPKKSNNNLLIILICIIVLSLIIITTLTVGLVIILRRLFNKIQNIDRTESNKKILLIENIIIVLSLVIVIANYKISLIITSISSMILLIISLFDKVKIKEKKLFFILPTIVSLIISFIFIYSAINNLGIVGMLLAIIIYIFYIKYLIDNMKYIKRK